MVHLYLGHGYSNLSGFKVAASGNAPAGHWPVGHPWSRFRFSAGPFMRIRPFTPKEAINE